MTAALLALVSAASFAVATVLGHRVATTVYTATAEPRRWALLRRTGRLLRHPGFLAAQLAGAAGFALHAAALASGLVVVVQPLLCTGMVLALALGAVVDRRHPGRPLPHRRQWAAAVLVVLGLGLFLGTAAPAAGAAAIRGWVLPLAVAGFGGLATAVALGVRGRRIRRPALILGALAGTAFGLSGVLLKVVTTLPVRSWPTAWSVYALVAVGLLGSVVAQWSYSAGPLVHSQPVLTALEPVVALALAAPVFGEQLAGGLLPHAGQLTGLALMVAGVVEVARHSAVAATAPAGAAAAAVAT